MQKPSVSICIPTYNRAECLKKSLDILAGLEAFDKVEVVISDNCSTDGTEALCKDFCKAHPNAVYFKNERNVFDANFPLALSRASGLYRKLANDNTVYCPDYLKCLLEHVEGLKDKNVLERPLLILLNDIRVPQNASVRLSGLGEFARTAGYRATWIGCFGLWAEDCEGLETEFAYCREHHLWQLKKNLELIASGRDFVILINPVAVLPVSGKDLSYGIHAVFYKEYLGLFEPYVEQGKMQRQDAAFAKKDLLYNYFAKYVFQQDYKKIKVDFGGEPDFKKKILAEYKTEKYYAHFCVWYFLSFRLAKPAAGAWRRLALKAKNKLAPTAFGRKLFAAKKRLRIKFY